MNGKSGEQGEEEVNQRIRYIMTDRKDMIPLKVKKTT